MRLLTLPTPESTTAPTERATALAFEDRRSHQLLQRVKQAAAGDAAVLLAGETGTGQEILARYVHELGARQPAPADVRVIAAASVPLEDMVAVDRFREDLLSRLSGAAIAVPPLRERPPAARATRRAGPLSSATAGGGCRWRSPRRTAP